jgi:hypothetical protein
MSDLLERMRRNPAGDWNIGDVEACADSAVYNFVPVRGHLTAMRSILPRAKF